MPGSQLGIQMKAKAEKSVEEVVSNDVGEGSEQELGLSCHKRKDGIRAARATYEHAASDICSPPQLNQQELERPSIFGTSLQNKATAEELT